jgi:hypothetical protein
MTDRTPGPAAPPRRSAAWPPFERALADALACLEDDQFLIVGVARTHRYVQFAGQGARGLRAEASGNAYLAPGERLGPRQLERLCALGWHAPTGTPAESTPERDPDGSPNPFVDWPVPVPFADVARAAVDTLVDVMAVDDPARLEYQAFDADGRTLDLPALMLRRARRDADARAAAQDVPDDRARLLDALREATGLAALEYDADDDVTMVYGELPVIACLLGDPPRVRLHAPLLRPARRTRALLGALDALNARPGGPRCFVHGDAVVACLELPARPLVTRHVIDALQGFSVRCETDASALALRFAEDAGEGRSAAATVLQ